ncbi:MAG TPA: DNA-directed RNA polymerase subunit alpha C-terminal domain-containing protein [Candidatus Gracilibacteria bacterium]|nr:DNA-directed RNA polymerase subunit alpha C-terminal domain-containing protein [Candidatus Gracilibacteria bacterium]
MTDRPNDLNEALVQTVEGETELVAAAIKTAVNALLTDLDKLETPERLARVQAVLVILRKIKYSAEETLSKISSPFKPTAEPSTNEQNPESEEDVPLELLLLQIKNLKMQNEIGRRIEDMFCNGKTLLLGDLIQLSAQDLLKVKNVGRTTVKKIKEAVESIACGDGHLHLGTKLTAKRKAEFEEAKKGHPVLA